MTSAGGVKTTCPYCGVGCGVIATRRPDGTVAIKGDPDHPANFGRLCSKGSALGETLSLEGRLLNPLVFGKEASWDSALSLVASRFRDAIEIHGPDSVAIYGSGQLLTEDYYVANKLMKGFIGSANIDTNSRLCMASSVAGHVRAFGADTVPGSYEDLEQADLVVLVGSNLAWCHPILYQRLAAAREKRGTKVVVVDPRRTATCEIADIHLAIAPGSDVALFNGLLAHLARSNAFHADFVYHATEGADAARTAAEALTLTEIADATGVEEAELIEFYALVTATDRTVTVYSQGVNQSECGSDKVNAIINCHLATGRIGKPGMGPFSVTGQPNAMGGREVGGLANMLAAHLEIANAAHRDLVQQFWGSPRIAERAGLKAVDLFRAVGEGRIKALWILSTNPVVSLPEADNVRRAIARCPFVVVSDAARYTGTTELAHVLLPSAAWGEKSGTVTNSERRISRQRAFLPAPGEARADWWQLAEVGRRLGFERAFDYPGPGDIFREHAMLSGVENGGTRDFDISGLAALDAAGYDAMEPVQWPVPADGPGRERFFGDGRFFTGNGRARFVATPFRAPRSRATGEFTLVLNTGRIRDQWHTMTRTGKAARLMAHTAEPFVEMHPDDASSMGLEAARLAVIESAHGECIARVQVSERTARGQAFMPIHWTDRFTGRARVDTLIAARTDPVSGQPDLKNMPVNVSAYPAKWFAFAVACDRPAAKALDSCGYWAIAPAAGGWRLELAGLNAIEDVTAIFQSLLPKGGNVETVSYHDGTAGQARFAAFDGERLIAALFVAKEPVAAAREQLAAALETPFADAGARLRLLAGRTSLAAEDGGPIVCACLGIGRKAIVNAVTGGAATVEAVGEATLAGTNCGSCRAEIQSLIRSCRTMDPGAAGAERSRTRQV